jgi:hypothetical protein
MHVSSTCYWHTCHTLLLILLLPADTLRRYYHRTILIGKSLVEFPNLNRSLVVPPDGVCRQQLQQVPSCAAPCCLHANRNIELLFAGLQ